jgi:biotin operon repressor
MRIIEQIIESIREKLGYGKKPDERENMSDHEGDYRPFTDYDYTLDQSFAESLLKEEAIPDFSSDPIHPKKGTKQAKLLKLLSDHEGISVWYITHKLKVSKSAAYSLIHDLRRRGHQIERTNGLYILKGE